MRRFGTSHCLGFLAAFAFTASYAQERLELKLSLSTVSSNVRSHAPLSLDIRMESWSQELLEGRLELTCYDGNKLLNQYRSSELVLSAGERLSRTVLPPMSLSKDLSLLTVVARFVSESSAYDLGQSELRVPAYWRRSFVIGVVHPDETAFGASGRELGEALRLDQFEPRVLRGYGLISTPSIIVPQELRPDGLGLFSFDVLGLTKQGFRELLPDQLDAIGDWVEAGGSLLVMVDRQTSVAQQEFLNRIMGISQDDPLSLMDTGSLLAETSNETGLTVHQFRPGMGRAVILSSMPKETETTELREIVAFLWKIRANRFSNFRWTGTLDVPQQLVSQRQGLQSQWGGGSFANPYEPYRPFKQIRLAEADGLTAILLPERVRGIPFGVVVVILVLFLIAIVPLDYFLLGHFNLRRYTWVLLPVVSLGFTYLTVWLGNSYLGSTDYRTSLEFVDLTTDNRVVRSSQFELLFTAKQREVTTELKQTLHTVIAERQTDNEDAWNSAAGMTATGVQQPLKQELPIYEGNLPGSFTIRQPMRQWSPQLSRQTSFQTERPVPPFDLDDVEELLLETPGLLASPEWQRELRDRIPLSESESTVLLFHNKEVFEVAREAKPKNDPAPKIPPDSKDGRLRELIRKVCVRPAGGLFSFVSQISPNGAADFEDLALLDPSDPNQWLLVVVRPQGNDYVVFRRLFLRRGL